MNRGIALWVLPTLLAFSVADVALCRDSINDSALRVPVDSGSGAENAAEPDQAVDIALLALTVPEGNSSPSPLELLREILRGKGGVRPLSAEEVSAGLGPEWTATLDGCIVTPCMVEAARTLGVPYVVIGWFDVAPPEGGLRVKIVEGKKGALVFERSYAVESDGLSEKLADVAEDIDSVCMGSGGPPEKRATMSEAEARTATIDVSVSPVQGRLFLDGKPLGQTPVRLKDLAPGSYVVKIIAPGYRQFERRLDVLPGARSAVKVRLVADCPSFTVLSNPPGAVVTVDGKDLGTTPLTTQGIIEGVHSVDLALAEYAPVKRKIIVQGRDCDTLRYQLVSKAYADSVRQMSARRWRTAARITLGGAAAGFWALGFAKNAQEAAARREKKAVYETYSQPGLSAPEYDRYWAEYSSAASRADEAAGRRSALYVVAGILSAGFGLTFVF